MAGPNDPFGALSPFSDVLPPEEQYYRDMAEQAAPVDLNAIDMSPEADAVDPGAFPDLESFQAAMEPDPGMFAEDEGMQTGGPELPPEQALVPIDPHEAAMAQEQEFMEPYTGLGVEGLEAPVASETLFGQQEYQDELMGPTDAAPVESPAIGDMPTRDLQIQEFEAAQAKEARRRELQTAADSDELKYQAKVAKTREDAAVRAQQRIEDIYTESKAISEQGVDNDRWWGSRSTGQKIGAYISAMIGGQQGLMSGRGGNDALDLIMGEIDKDIASQKFDIQNKRAGLKERRGLVHEIYEKTGDIFQAQATAHLAARQGIAAEIDNELAGMDPEGTSARSLEMYKRKLISNSMAEMAQIKQANRDQEIKDGDFQIRQDEQARKEAKDAVDMAVAARKARLVQDKDGNWVPMKGGRGGGGKMSADYINKTYPGANVSRPMDQKQLDAHLATVGKVQTLTGTKPKGAMSPQEQLAQIQIDERDAERVRTLGFGGLKKRDGTPLLAGSPTQAGVMANLKADTDIAMELLDEIIMIREDKGGEYFKTKKGRNLLSKHAQVLSRLSKIEGWGALSEGDLTLGRNFTTTSDPNEYRDYSAAMLDLRQDLVDKANSVFRSIGDGEAAHYEPDRKTRETVHERTVSERLSSISEGLPEAAKTDPRLREGLIAKKAQDALDIAESYSPEYGDTRAVGDIINQQLSSGEYSPEEAKRIVLPMGRRMAGQFKRTIEGKTTEELLELQKNPAFMREVGILSAVRGKPSDEQIYELVTGAQIAGAAPEQPTAPRKQGTGGHKGLSPDLERALEAFK